MEFQGASIGKVPWAQNQVSEIAARKLFWGRPTRIITKRLLMHSVLARILSDSQWKPLMVLDTRELSPIKPY